MKKILLHTISSLLEELSSAGFSQLSSARKASLALLTPVSLALAVLSTACQDQDVPVPGLLDEDGGFVAYKADQVEHSSRTVGPNSYFPVGTYYFYWSYTDNNGDPNYADRHFFPDGKYKKDLNEGEYLPALGKESGTHYVELASDNKKQLNGHMHLYGLCINGDELHDKYGLEEVVELAKQSGPTKTIEDYASDDNGKDALKSILHIKPRGVDADRLSLSYYDYCRGYVHYNPEYENDPFYNQSSFTIPFTHVMSQVRVSVLQEGEAQFIEKEDENGNKYEEAVGDRAFDINLQSISILNEITSVEYNAITNTYTFDQNDINAVSTENKRMIWKDTDETSDFPIPVASDANHTTNIQATTLLIPQGIKPDGTTDDDFTLPTTGNTLWLELVITGTEAWKFDNDHQESSKDDANNVTVRIPIEDNTTPQKKDPLRFLPNHAYKLVVMFHGDNVQVVTIKPLLYPWFDGERDAKDDENGFYEPTDIGSPMVFGNVQWNDRYMGSDWVAPTNLDEFVKATGFYYQNGRSIPFYPTSYDETNATIYDVNWDEFKGTPNLGTQATVTMNEAAIPYTQGSNLPVYFLAGGKWRDVSVGEMTKYPVVHPVVPYKLPWSQRAIKENDNTDFYDLYQKEKFNWSNGDRYVCNVDDYYDKKTGTINTFNLNNQEAAYIMRFIANMDGSHSDAWNDPNKHPCPPGWRLPTKDELYTILPSSPLAGNITFLRDFGVHDGSIGSFDGDGKDDSGNPVEGKERGHLKDGDTPVLEFYLKLPYVNATDIYPTLENGNYGSKDTEKPQTDANRSTNFPAYDPEPGDQTQYVISKRKYSAEEYANLDENVKNKISEDEYKSYARQIFCGSPLNPSAGPGKHDNFTPREWGTIFAIKKQGSPDAYRMRWRVERMPADSQGNEYDIYQIVVDKYKCSRTDFFKYKIEDINDPNYFLKYDWDHPESTLYFPITGIVADFDMAKYMPEGSRGPVVYNYGSETILLTSDYVDGQPYAWTYRIKIAGTNSYSLYLYPSEERLAQGGQVRPVRTAR